MLMNSPNRSSNERIETNADQSDHALIARVAVGELQALNALYTAYARPVFSLALRILGDAADAEEVVQDVFERVWRHARTFDPGRGRLGTWLLSMTHHVAIDHLRKRQRRPATMGGGAAELAARVVPDTGVDVSGAVLHDLEAEQVRRALRSLPFEQQQAIELAYFGGLSHLEIAALLGDPLGTVKARIRRGMERLRSALEGFGVGVENDADK
jgi:RNA polymerase sigma-70 factor (ECF subfamily)